MSREFPSNKENDKWMVQMSIGKKPAKSKPTQNVRRTLNIKKTPPKTAQSTEKWKEELLSFILESKKQVDTEARNAIETVRKWQEMECARMDLIQQYISTSSHEITLPLSTSTIQELSAMRVVPSSCKSTATSNSENSNSKKVANKPSKNNVTTRASTSGQTVKNQPKANGNRSVPVEPVISMPILFDEEEDISTFFAKPINNEKSTAQRIEKRRHSDTHYRPLNETFDFPVRKKSNTFHSSVLAMSNKLTKTTPDASNEQPKEDVGINDNTKPQANKPDKDKNGETNSNDKNKPGSCIRDPILQQFLELKKIVDEKAKIKAQQEAKTKAVTNGENSSQAGLI